MLLSSKTDNLILVKKLNNCLEHQNVSPPTVSTIKLVKGNKTCHKIVCGGHIGCAKFIGIYCGVFFKLYKNKQERKQQPEKDLVVQNIYHPNNICQYKSHFFKDSWD